MTGIAYCKLDHEHKYPYSDCVWEKVATFGDWISVKDRLPEMGKDVLCICTNGPHTQEIAMLCDDGAFINQYAYRCHITHWMPLPDPPKEG